MKTTIFVAMLAAAALVGACDKKEGGGDAKASGDGSGVKECDEYFEKVKNCKGMPEAAKKAMDDAAKSMKDNISKAANADAKKAFASSCKQASDALQCK
jgi:hypothetical protein